MDRIPIDLGNRKLQFGSGAHVINIPAIAVRTLQLKTGDVMRWTLSNNTLQLHTTQDNTNESK